MLGTSLLRDILVPTSARGSARTVLTRGVPSGSDLVARPQKYWLERLHRLQVAPDPQAEDGLHKVSSAGRQVFLSGEFRSVNARLEPSGEQQAPQSVVLGSRRRL